MEKTRLFAPVLAFSMLLFGAIFAYADLHEGKNVVRQERIPGQYIVVFNDSTDAATAESEILSRTRGERLYSYRSAVSGFSARFSSAELETVKNDPRVAFISEDRVVSISRSDTLRSDTLRVRNVILPPKINKHRRSSTVAKPAPTPAQTLPTGIDRINAEGGANKGTGVNVAVIDTGIQINHPDLSANIVGGKNCSSGNSYNDGNGHGTHVAGTIAGIDNGEGVVGVAPEAKLWAVRVLNNSGSGTWSSVICGIDFVTSKAPANGGLITVANLSLGGGGVSDNNCGNSNNDALHKALCRARDAGVTIIVAAGNSGVDATTQVPAAYDDAVITVSALADSDGKAGGTGGSTSYGADDTFATFSNWGAPVDIGAPGVSIYSTWTKSGYKSISGTSMASPHVAGAAALYLATYPNAVWTEVRDAMISTGEQVGNGHSDPSGRHPERVLRVDNLSAWSGGGEPAPDPEPDPDPEPPPVNNSPTAVAGSDQGGLVGDAIQFDGSGSSDSDGTITSYSWDFGDGASQSGVSVSHVYNAAGIYTATLTVEDDGGLSANDSATITIENVPPPAGGGGFTDSFENGLGNWTQDSQNDWKNSTQRSSDGNYSIEVDGRANNASIQSGVIDLGGSTNATIEFDWYIEKRLDRGEYIAFDISKNGGSSWEELRILKGNVDSENTWHSESVVVSGISSLKIRFRGTMNRSNEDAFVDNVRVITQ